MKAKKTTAKKPDPEGLLPKKAEAAHPLDQLADVATEGAWERLLMHLIWKARFDNPRFTVNITPEDMKGFDDCVNYLKVAPVIKVFRPQGTKPTEGRPAQGNRRAVPAHPGTPPKDYVVVQMVDDKGDAFVPVENNEADNERRIRTAAMIRTRETANGIAAQLQNDLQSQTYSQSTIQDAIRALLDLSRPA